MKILESHYRTSDGLADYKFSFEEQRNGTWKAYIERQPSYHGRSANSQLTHRLSDGNRKHICWDKPLRSLSDAKGVAATWADKTQEYIKTGKSF